MGTAEEVASAERRLRADGLETTGVEETVCCFAEKTETWLADPDGARWKWYVKSGDAGQLEKTVAGRHASDAAAASTTCCS